MKHSKGKENYIPVPETSESKVQVDAQIIAEHADILYNNITDDSTVITDGFGAYTNIDKVFDQHVMIMHNLNQFKVAGFHTNTIEGFWSILKRGIIGIYHFVSVKHLVREVLNRVYFQVQYQKHE